MNDNRLYKRYEIQCNGSILSGSHQNYEFITNNISAGGMSITTDREVADESPVTIMLDVTNLLLPRAQLQGMIVRKDADDSAFNYGIRFMDLSNLEIAEIDEHLRDTHFSSLTHRVENPAVSQS
jgi:c-di-GMP-binding flagellar brake protein YcgR